MLADLMEIEVLLVIGEITKDGHYSSFIG